jgi:hypothetical protein
MSASAGYQWRRDKDGLGVWEHRGKVAVAGVGHSPVDRRWDEVSMDKTLGAYSILACRKAMDEAGVTPDQIEGVICCDSHIAGGSGGSASQWAPRPYFAPPYDSEWGLTLVNAQWLIEQMRLPNIKFAPTGVPTISEMVGMAAQAVATEFATLVSSSTRQAISKAAIVAVARTPTTTPAAPANGPHPGAITAATISSTSSRTISTA